MRFLLLVIFIGLGLKIIAQTLPENKISVREVDDHKKLKYTSGRDTPKTYLDVGGQVRAQYFYIKNKDWIAIPQSTDGYFLGRVLLHADFKAGSHFRTFVELQSSLATEMKSPSPVDHNPLEVHQAYIDLTLNPGGKSKLIFRPGRQEFLYGSQRLIGVREGPNNRQSFDGIKSMFTSGDYKIDLFYSHPVGAKKGIFNDHLNRKVKLWGAYLTKNQFPFLKNVDLYYLGLWKDQSVFDGLEGRELRHTAGSRIWGKTDRWRYDIEGVYQFGKLDLSHISAWSVSANIGYMLKGIILSPEIGLKTELISGDARNNDQRLQTLNPLFPRGGYFGLAALIGPVNIFDIHPSISLNLSKKTVLEIDYDIFWRYSKNDGIYGPNAMLIYSGKGIDAKFIGQQFSSNLSYEATSFLSLATELTWFKPGTFLKRAGADKDILFAGLTTQIKF